MPIPNPNRVHVCSSLGMCKRCGDLRMIACSRCKGLGMVKGEPFNFSIVEDLYQSFVGGEVTAASVPCTKCQAKGCFSCPDCS